MPDPSAEVIEQQRTDAALIARRTSEIEKNVMLSLSPMRRKKVFVEANKDYSELSFHSNCFGLLASVKALKNNSYDITKYVSDQKTEKLRGVNAEEVVKNIVSLESKIHFNDNNDLKEIERSYYRNGIVCGTSAFVAASVVTAFAVKDFIKAGSDLLSADTPPVDTKQEEVSEPAKSFRVKMDNGIEHDVEFFPPEFTAQ